MAALHSPPPHPAPRCVPPTSSRTPQRRCDDPARAIAGSRPSHSRRQHRNTSAFELPNTRLGLDTSSLPTTPVVALADGPSGVAATGAGSSNVGAGEQRARFALPLNHPTRGSSPCFAFREPSTSLPASFMGFLPPVRDSWTSAVPTSRGLPNPRFRTATRSTKTFLNAAYTLYCSSPQVLDQPSSVLQFRQPLHALLRRASQPVARCYPSLVQITAARSSNRSVADRGCQHSK